MTFKSGPPPLQEPIEEPAKETKPQAAPRNPRGRPRMDGKPAGSVPPQKPVRNLQPQIAGLLMTLNFGLMLVPPLSRDMLDEAEILALSTAIADEAKRNARFAKMVDLAINATGSAGLFGIIGIVAGRRLARHGMIPPEADAQLGALLGMMYPTTNAKSGRNAPNVWPLNGNPETGTDNLPN